MWHVYRRAAESQTGQRQIGQAMNFENFLLLTLVFGLLSERDILKCTLRVNVVGLVDAPRDFPGIPANLMQLYLTRLTLMTVDI